ncbi:hypothetical protein Mal15_25240 [Stieleria maiorica]|uniref:Uncharacterized protein n=1 Tax=Stieleria maiorica TaxID=2795974 RepID=A0A5B9MBB9_9BACT|nr:hypothetical protein [Stieleria maiorica]QEF98472.1 hypothetical protein Mal15_25240 [Stieleria maiorica]
MRTNHTPTQSIHVVTFAKTSNLTARGIHLLAQVATFARRLLESAVEDNAARFAGLAIALFAVTAMANPNTQDPHKPLSALGTISGAEKQIQAMYAKFAEWEALVISSAEAVNAGRRFPHQQLSRIYPETSRGIWYAEQLEAMGEPAGKDLKRKFTLLRKAMGNFSTRLQEFQPKELATLRNETENRRKTLARAAELAGEGKLVEAERTIRTLHLKQLQSVFYLPHSQARSFENEVNVPHLELLNRLNRQRRKDYQAEAKVKIQAYVDAVETLKTESNRVATELQHSSTVTIKGGQAGDAGDAIEYVMVLWGNASAAVARSVAVAWAFSDRDANATAEPFQRIIAQLESIGNESVANVVTSAAQSTPRDQVAVLYPKVLRALAQLDRRMLGTLDQNVITAAGQLAAKAPDFAEQVQRYSDATVEPTRWRRRYAAQQIRSVERDFPQASNLLNRELAPESTGPPGIYGAHSSRPRILTPGLLSYPADWIVRDAKTVLGMTTSDGPTLRLSPTADAAIVPQDPRHYTSLTATFPIDDYLADLKDCLLLDDSHGPLDLSAADALSSAELQEFQTVGGRIAGLTLEPFVSRFATMPDQASALLPLNRLPNIDARSAPAEQMIWRVDLEPQWVAHSMFVAIRPPAQ